MNNIAKHEATVGVLEWACVEADWTDAQITEAADELVQMQADNAAELELQHTLPDGSPDGRMPEVYSYSREGLIELLESERQSQIEQRQND